MSSVVLVSRFVPRWVGLFVVVSLSLGCVWYMGMHVCGVVVSGLFVCPLIFDITMTANLFGFWFFGISAFGI